MRHLRWALLATAVLAYPAPALAGGGGRPVVAPSSSQDLAETLETFLELPAPVNPRYGYGTDPCVKVGRDRLRSSPIVRIFGAPPATGTIAMLLVAYQMSFESPPVR